MLAILNALNGRTLTSLAAPFFLCFSLLFFATAEPSMAERHMQSQESRASDERAIFKIFPAKEFIGFLGCSAKLKNAEGAISVLIKPGPDWRAELTGLPHYDELPSRVINQFHSPDTEEVVLPHYLKELSLDKFSSWYQDQSKKSSALSNSLYLALTPSDIFEMLRSTRRIKPTINPELSIWRNGRIVGTAEATTGQNPRVDPVLFGITYFLPNNFIANAAGIPPECVTAYLSKLPDTLTMMGYQGAVHDGEWASNVKCVDASACSALMNIQ